MMYIKKLLRVKTDIVNFLLPVSSLRLYYQQGECLVLKPISGDMEELQEIVTRLKAVTMGCEVSQSGSHCLYLSWSLVSLRKL